MDVEKLEEKLERLREGDSIRVISLDGSTEVNVELDVGNDQFYLIERPDGEIDGRAGTWDTMERVRELVGNEIFTETTWESN